MRPSWDEYFLSIALVVASRSTCVKRGVGAILVRHNHILSTGYNGVPRGAPHRDETTCVRIGVESGTQPDRVCCSHAEVSALSLAAYHGARTQSATLYCTTSPCAGCARALINAGIVRVVYAEGYDDPQAASVFAESGITVDHVRRTP